MEFEKKNLLEVYVIKTDLHEWFRNQVDWIDANDVILGIGEHPTDHSKYRIQVEKVD